MPQIIIRALFFVFSLVSIAAEVDLSTQQLDPFSRLILEKNDNSLYTHRPSYLARAQLRRAVETLTSILKGAEQNDPTSTAWGAQQVELNHSIARNIMMLSLQAAARTTLFSATTKTDDEQPTKLASSQILSFSKTKPDSRLLRDVKLPPNIRAMYAEIRGGLKQLLSIDPQPLTSFPLVRRSVMALLMLNHLEASSDAPAVSNKNSTLEDVYASSMKGTTRRSKVAVKSGRGRGEGADAASAQRKRDLLLDLPERLADHAVEGAGKSLGGDAIHGISNYHINKRPLLYTDSRPLVQPGSRWSETEDVRGAYFPQLTKRSRGLLDQVKRISERRFLTTREDSRIRNDLGAVHSSNSRTTKTVDADDADSVPTYHDIITDEIMQDLYRLHVRGMAARGLLEHIHVSKAAGSTICQLAEKNKCSTEIFAPNAGKGNCLIPRLDDLPRWVDKEAHIRLGFPSSPLKGFVRYGDPRSSPAAGGYDCEARQKLLNENNWNFYGNEYTAVSEGPEGRMLASSSSMVMAGDLSSGSEKSNDGKKYKKETTDFMTWQPTVSVNESQYHPRGGTCPQFATVLVFRNPHERIVSHASYIMEQYISYYLDKQLMTKEELLGTFRNMSVLEWKALAPPAFDNYYARTLLGEPAFNAPLAKWTMADLSSARAVLASVDVLLDTGAPLSDRLNLQYGLGWRYGSFSTVHSKVRKKPLRSQEVGRRRNKYGGRGVLMRSGMDHRAQQQQQQEEVSHLRISSYSQHDQQAADAHKALHLRTALSSATGVYNWLPNSTASKNKVIQHQGVGGATLEHIARRTLVNLPLSGLIGGSSKAEEMMSISTLSTSSVAAETKSRGAMSSTGTARRRGIRSSSGAISSIGIASTVSRRRGSSSSSGAISSIGTAFRRGSSSSSGAISSSIGTALRRGGSSSSGSGSVHLRQQQGNHMLPDAIRALAGPSTNVLDMRLYQAARTFGMLDASLYSRVEAVAAVGGGGGSTSTDHAPTKCGHIGGGG